MSDERKQRQLVQHGKKESTFLRLRRTKLGLDDFRTVKVIGKGAFGEVSCVSFGFLAVLNHWDAGTTGSED
jgi:protein-serine/threonine kinase